MKKEKKNKVEEINKNNKIKNMKQESGKGMFHNYLCYIIIFSLIGLLIEVIFCFIPTGNIESGKGLVLGPLCPLYGIGVAIIILFLNKYEGHKFKLFIYGTILGAVIEYLISFLLEGICGVIFWNYSWAKFNLNGRICLTFSILWGILTVILIQFAKKWIDKLTNKLKGMPRKIIDIILVIILILDIAITAWGVTVYKVRAKETLNGKNYTSNNNIIEKFQNTVFSNENMEKIFPNLYMIDNNGNQILIRNIFNK